ncbi:SusC/RagA family TonB-linked outer membrane protein [Nonlabens sp.]|uniref:SusC/RagA family TonB-linked outer membrane protein n=1 Tax=Nonlabens sp. TaxID=1888209 RepID=UPI003F69BCE3
MNKFTLLLFYLVAALGFAQQSLVSGKVLDQATGETLLGVTVQNITSQTATTTDIDGLFTIAATKGDVLRFSYIGTVTKEFALGDETSITVMLEEDVATLEEIVVVGYGTQAVREVTGAVSIVNSEAIENLKPARVEEALQGQVPGVNVTSSSGSPGAGLNIRIRGVSTNGDNRPLILVDGNIIEDLSVINPGDIESISVLKDATAGIYGVRAANGVIIVTTKSGRRNLPLVVEYNSWGGAQETSRRLPTLNSQQYALIKNEAFANNGEALPFTNISNLTNTNYQDKVFQNALVLNNDISMRGGTEKSLYKLGVSVFNQDGIVGGKKSDFDRFTMSGNFDHKWTKNLEMKTGFIYSYTSNRSINDGGLGSVLFNAVNMAPTIPVRDAAGEFSLAEGLGNEVINPEAQLANTFNKNKVGKISGNFGLTYSFLDHFEATARIQANYSEAYGNNFNPRAFYGAGKVFNLDENVYSEYENFFSDYTYDAFIKYNNSFNDSHNIEAMLGMSAFRTRGDFNDFTGFGNGSNDYNEVSLAGADRRTSGDEIVGSARRFDQRLLSHFLRVQYDYQGKYLFSGVIRRDGSTIFGPENRFGIFPSASLGWVASDESFLKDSKVIDFLKVRASAGIIGNDRIPAFGYVSLLTGEGQYVFNDQIFNGTAGGALSNPEIKWEEQFTTNVGVDMQFLSNKLNVTVDYFNRETQDLLIAPNVSGILGSGAPGSSAPFINGGDIRNRGLELSIGYGDQITDDLSFNVSYNIATLDNEVLAVNNDNGFIEAGGFGVGQPPITRFEEGFTIGYFYGYQTDGIFQNAAEVAAHPSQIALGANAQPGDFRYRDLNNDGVINLEDRTELGDPLPDVTMGMNLSFNYKNWDFQSYFFASLGNEMVRNYERNQPLTNTTTNILNRWTGEGSTNSFPRVTTGATANQVFSDFYVEDASFLRAQNIQLGYTLNDSALKNVKLSKLRIYGAVRNAFTLTRYQGFDPSASSGDPLASGIDNGFYPVARTFLIGINAKF